HQRGSRDAGEKPNRHIWRLPPERLRPVEKEGFELRAQVEGTLTGEVGRRCQLTHRPQRMNRTSSRQARDEGRRERRPSLFFGRRCFTSALRLPNRRVTRSGNSPSMRRLAVALATLSLLACAGPAAGAGWPPQIPRIPGKWSHVELNVTIKRVPHTLIVDRGKIVQITTTSVTLREPDGETPTIALTDQTIVT